MSFARLFDKGREGFLDADIDWSVDTIKVGLIDLGTSDVGIKQVTGATNATPIVITSTSHGFSNGDVVGIVGVGGNTAANGIFKIANVAASTFELTNVDTGANIAGNGAYTSGGSILNFTLADNLDDISAALVGTAVTLASKTSTLGVADAADVTFTAVSGASCEAIAIWKDTGVESTSRLIFAAANYTGLAITPNGGNITLTWDNGANKIFKL